MENIKNKYDWDLESILNGKSIDELFEEWKKKKEKILNLYPDFYKSESNFVNWKKVNHDFENLSNRLVNYVSNNLNEDVINPKWISWSQKITNEFQEINVLTSNITNIILKNKKLFESYLKNPELKEYVRGYELLFKSAKHILSDKEEKLLSHLSLNDEGYEEVFSTLVDGTIKFSDVKNSKGKTFKIKNIADVSLYLKSSDRELRKNTWYSFNNAYYNMKDVLTNLLYYNYLTLNTNSEVRKYKDYIDSTCDDDEIKEELILSIYKNVEKYKSLYKKFYDKRNSLIKKTYKLDKVEPWDKSLDVVKNNKRYSIEEAQEMAINVLKPFGDEYVDTVKRSFDEKWISWLPKENKHSGAYSIGGTRGLDKYFISMNFDKTLSSIYTLVHEMGHSMHSYYFGKKQKVHASCKIFYAEIASITNEVLLSLYLLKNSDDKKLKLNILDELITGFFSTTTRQIIFSNFEYDVVQKIKNKEAITYDVLANLYADMNIKYAGGKKEKMLSEKYKINLATILRISHFYVGNFYVYKYAIGQIPALIAGYRIFNNDKNFIKKYFDFLESGSSISPIETIKLLDIDLYKDDSFDECYKILENLINEYINLSK